MNVVLVVVGLLLLALVVWLFTLYNRMIALRNAIDRAWANVDVALKQRNDEVPNLVAVVKGYAAHERDAFERVTAARAGVAGGASMGQRAAASEQLSAGVRQLFAVAEAYPSLKADQGYLALQKRLSALEDLIADRREFYNESVRLYNTRIQEFPDVLLARRMRFEARPYFKAEGADRAVPSVA
jgi:LemA protein